MVICILTVLGPDSFRFVSWLILVRSCNVLFVVQSIEMKLVCEQLSVICCTLYKYAQYAQYVMISKPYFPFSCVKYLKKHNLSIKLSACLMLKRIWSFYFEIKFLTGFNVGNKRSYIWLYLKQAKQNF